MEILINNKVYRLKYTIRALFIFEQITNKQFAIKNITDTYIFLYSVLLANNPDMELSFEELINFCDDDMTIINNFNKFIFNENQKNNIFDKDKNQDDTKKKSLTIKEVIQLIVFQYKLCSYEYIMNDMQMYELDYLLSSINYSYREEYEIMRFQSYVTAQTQSTKKIDMKDIVKFSWDNENEYKVTTISDADIQRLRDKAEKMSAFIK